MLERNKSPYFSLVDVMATFQLQLKSFLIIIAFLYLGTAVAQKRVTENLAKYEFEALHFGFSLGVNTTNFVITPKVLTDSVLVVESTPQYGFNIGIISELRLHRYVTLRFLPNISFGQRNLDYTIRTVKGDAQYIKKVESTFLDFPLDIKLRAARLNNFSMYVLGGAKFTIDLASQKGVDNTSLDLSKQVVKLNRDDFGYEMGAGAEFYLTYFKFAIEAKMSLGLRDLLIRDNTVFSNSIDRLYSQMFLISFTFEG